MKAMGTAPLTLSSCLKIDPVRLLVTSTGHKPTIMISRRNNMITLHQASLFPSGRLQLMCGHKCRHLVKAVGINGGDENDGIKNARGVVGATATVVLACFIGAMCFTRPMCRPALAWPSHSSSPTSKTETKGETAESTLAALMHWEMLMLPTTDQRGNIKKEAQEAQTIFDKCVSKDNVNPASLKAAVRKLAFTADKDKAAKARDKLRKRYEGLLASKKPQEARNFGLALVEMLIYQKKYGEAYDLAGELYSTAGSPSAAADPILYKVVISLMLDKKNSLLDLKNSKELWNEFENKVLPEPGVSTETIEFEDFQKQMQKLKAKINGRV